MSQLPKDPITQGYNLPTNGTGTYFHADDPFVPILTPGRDPRTISRDDPRIIPVDQGHVNIFDLSNGDQLQRYNEIVDLTAKGAAEILREELLPIPEKEKFLCFVRWVSKVYTGVKDVHNTATVDSHGQVVFRAQSRR